MTHSDPSFSVSAARRCVFFPAVAMLGVEMLMVLVMARVRNLADPDLVRVRRRWRCRPKWLTQVDFAKDLLFGCRNLDCSSQSNFQ